MLVSAVLLAGCASAGQDVAAVKAELQAQVTAKLAEVDPVINTKLQSAVGDITTRVNAKVDAKVDALSTTMNQRLSAFASNQNNGAFSGGGLYVTVLAAIVVLALLSAVVAVIVILVKQRHQAVKARDASALLTGTIMSSIKTVRNRHGDDAKIAAALDEIKSQSEKVGVDKMLNTELVRRGLL